MTSTWRVLTTRDIASVATTAIRTNAAMTPTAG
jgi:hypothetical protein